MRAAPMHIAGKKIHFMGIGGIGVSALAAMARAAGAEVSGCDREGNALTAALERYGVAVATGHDPGHMAGKDVLVYSSAIPADHPERLAARGREMRRGELLAAFMDRPGSVGVSGTHGKTTTSWLLGHMLIAAGDDPALFIGGIVPALERGNHRPGTGRFVAELDESDASFLLPRLDAAVITNIESDHLGYYRDYASLLAAFAAFAAGVAGRGLLAVGIDSPEAARLFDRHRGRKIGCGFHPDADVRAVELEAGRRGSSFRILHRGADLGVFALAMPGRHNVQNALLALGTALELGYDAGALRGALPSARAVERRLEHVGAVGGAAVYSDYAHHPTEIAACIAAARQVRGGKLLVVFQPHLFTRTRDYADEFGLALAAADAVMLVDIYPAREEPLPGITSGLLVETTGRHNANVSGPYSLAAAAAAVKAGAAGYASIVMMGAGDIDSLARSLVARPGIPPSAP